MTEQEIIEAVEKIVEKYPGRIWKSEISKELVHKLKELGFVHRSWVGVDEDKVPDLIRRAPRVDGRFSTMEVAEYLSKSDIIKIKEPT